LLNSIAPMCLIRGRRYRPIKSESENRNDLSAYSRLHSAFECLNASSRRSMIARP
jgi:hypothetical protein